MFTFVINDSYGGFTLTNHFGLKDVMLKDSNTIYFSFIIKRIVFILKDDFFLVMFKVDER